MTTETTEAPAVVEEQPQVPQVEQTTEAPATPAGPAPDPGLAKFEGKSIEEVIEMHRNLERVTLRNTQTPTVPTEPVEPTPAEMSEQVKGAKDFDEVVDSLKIDRKAASEYFATHGTLPADALKRIRGAMPGVTDTIANEIMHARVINDGACARAFVDAVGEQQQSLNEWLGVGEDGRATKSPTEMSKADWGVYNKLTGTGKTPESMEAAASFLISKMAKGGAPQDVAQPQDRQITGQTSQRGGLTPFKNRGEWDAANERWQQLPSTSAESKSLLARMERFQRESLS